MPRDASGNYTLPAGNPVIGGTIISDSWANPTMSDVGDEITNSLDRNGRGGMLVPFRNADGTISGPGITWANEPTSGLFREGLGETRMGILGSPTTRWIDVTGEPVGSQKPFEIWNGSEWVAPEAGGGGDVLLDNNEFLLARNFNNSGTVNLIKANLNDEIEFGDVPALMPNTLVVVQGILGNLSGNADTATTAGSAGTAGTVTTPAQPAITSVGVLAGLTVTAPIAGSITGNAATATSATTAGSATTAVSAGTAGTVTVAAQPVITSVGTLTSLTVSGPLNLASLAVTGAGTFGTVTSAGLLAINSGGMNIVGTTTQTGGLNITGPISILGGNNMAIGAGGNMSIPGGKLTVNTAINALDADPNLAMRRSGTTSEHFMDFNNANNTDISNQRYGIYLTPTGDFVIGQSATDRSFVINTGSPTVTRIILGKLTAFDPNVVGGLWNNAGVINISAG